VLRLGLGQGDVQLQEEEGELSLPQGPSLEKKLPQVDGCEWACQLEEWLGEAWP
jgi:hypothetical protein